MSEKSTLEWGDSHVYHEHDLLVIAKSSKNTFIFLKTESAS